ncbi:MAG: outer membrane protein assembly factor BamA [Spirochaetales bacterium]|nr:outer membrane protein assembly factor BamA [Spirochaetales bacterium]
MRSIGNQPFIKIFFFLFLFTSLAGIVGAQEENAGEDDWYIGATIEDIRFEGLDTVSETELTGIVSPYIGDTFTNDLFWEIQGKLYALNYFTEILPRAERGSGEGQMVIVFEVTERPSVSNIQFTGNQRLRDGELMDVVLLKTGDMASKNTVQLDVEAIKGLYYERGFPDAEVTYDIEVNKENNTAKVTFLIDEGKQTTIKEIRFSGNDFASDGSLEGVLKTKKQSFFNSGVFQEGNLEEDIANIQSYYWDRGYVDARVVDVVREFDDEKSGESRNYMILTYYIEEGEQYTYGGMEFEGNRIFDTEELQELVRQEVGSVLSKSKLESDFQRVLDLYYENGYIFNEITREEQRNEEENTISYVVTIVERNRAHIENVIIKGNEKTKDSVIYREIPLEVGDVFSKTKVLNGMRNLYNLQYFSAITPETPQGSAPGLMDLVFNVEEQSTADIQFGLVFSGATEFPISGRIAWNDKNFLGEGMQFGVQSNISPYQQDISVSFTENWLFDQRWSAGIDFSFAHTVTTNVPQDVLAPVYGDGDENAVPDPFDGHYVFSSDTTYNSVDYEAGDAFPGTPTSSEIDNNDLVTDYEYSLLTNQSIPDQYTMDYDSYEISLGLNTGYSWHTRLGILSASTGLQFTPTYVHYDSSIYRPYDENDRGNLDQWRWINEWWTSGGWDTRDNKYNPQSGFYLNQQITFVGGFLGGYRDYIRTKSQAEYYHTLFDIPVTENWSFKSVLAMHTGLSLLFPTFGFSEINTITSDMLYIDGMFIARGWERQYGYKAIWNNWLELRFPINEQILWWDWFFDAAAPLAEREDLGALTADNFLFSVGGGLRFSIPQFPIRLYLAKRFRFDNGQFEWVQGDGIFGDMDLDFVISFGAEFF